METGQSSPKKIEGRNKRDMQDGLWWGENIRLGTPKPFRSTRKPLYFVQHTYTQTCKHMSSPPHMFLLYANVSL